MKGREERGHEGWQDSHDDQACEEDRPKVTPRTLKESAQFLRMSESNLYRRKDIPRFRLPNSRTLLFDLDQLEALVKQNQISGDGKPVVENPTTAEVCPSVETNGNNIIENSSQRVYHLKKIYR